MYVHCHLRAMTAGVIVTIAVIAAAATVACAANSAKSTGGKAAKLETPTTQVPIPPVVGETKTNLQKAFADEMNAKERYNTYARQADRERYPAVAQLFRACAAAEQVHADRHVHAIAQVGGEARVLLDRVYAGTTEQNLQSAVQSEDYEATEFYPALLARARADHEPEAVRSMTFALASERDHERLLAAALASLEQRPAAHPLYVCPYCGRTVETLDAGKCPTCFTDVKKFIRVGEGGPRPVAAAVSGAAGAPVTAANAQAKPPAPPLPRK